MTVLLMLFTLVLFLLTDYVIQKRHAIRLVAVAPAGLPDDVRLATNHLWLRNDANGTTTLGIDEFLAQLLGPVGNIALPAIGTSVSPETSDFALEDGSRALRLAAPLDGHIVDVDASVMQNPSLASADPYGKGWLVRVKARPSTGDMLVDHPREWLKQQTDLVKEFFAAQNHFATLQDGGMPRNGLLQNYDANVWQAFGTAFATLHRGPSSSGPR